QINIAEGQNLLVQVTREAYANKGVKISTKVAIPGRYMVLLPFDNLLGVSKKIPSFQERKRLRMCIKDTVRKSGYGCIIRTAAKGKSEEDFRADWDQLYKTWKSIESRIELASPPSIIYKDMNLAKSIIRDYLPSSTE